MYSSVLASLSVLFAAVSALPSTNSHRNETTTTSTPTVKLDYTTVSPAGGNASIGYYKYQNIRFAKSPTGRLRWAKPEWPDKETTENNGTLASSSVACNTEEDCLFLDVWAPANSSGKKLPVMVWTYGGGFTGGSKNENTPEGLFNLTKDFVFVAYNYRVGIAGLANGPTFQHEGGTSNLALWDVQHAFEWTRKYISKFGGDPEKITAVGFSAGASQTLFQITRFAGHAKQLFKQAYVMSPGFVPGAGHHHAERFWQNVSSTAGCAGGKLECMRIVNFTALNTAATSVVNQYTYQFQPRVDGDFVADTYESQFYQKRFNFSGPLVITHEQHEANSQAWSGVNTTADVSKYLRIFFPAITDDIVNEALTLYPEANYSSPGLRFADMKQSFDLTAHNLAVTQALRNETWNALVALGAATHGTDQSYYWYSTSKLSTTTTSSSTGSGSSGNTTSTGTGTITGGPPGGFGMGGGSSTSINSTVAITMQKYLMSFILTGNPNTMWSQDKINWPRYNSSYDTTTSTTTSGGGTQIVFNNTFYLDKDDLANDRSLFWNRALWW